jgi:hypothetical protein
VDVDEVINQFQANGLKIISAKQLAFARMQSSKMQSGIRYCPYSIESYVQEYVIENPNKEKSFFLFKEKPSFAKKHDLNSHIYEGNIMRWNSEYKQLKKLPNFLETLDKGKDYLQIDRSSSIPYNRFGENERTTFLFEEYAKEYGLFLKDFHQKRRTFDYQDERTRERIRKERKSNRKKIIISSKLIRGANNLFIRQLGDSSICDQNHWNKRNYVLGLNRLRKGGIENEK